LLQYKLYRSKGFIYPNKTLIDKGLNIYGLIQATLGTVHRRKTNNTT